jgi:Arc/MetJ family transcription regulator
MKFMCMRTNVEINETVLQQVQTLGNFSTKKAAIQAALIDYLNVLKRQQLLALRGKVAWQGDLDSLRHDRVNSSSGVAT